MLPVLVFKTRGKLSDLYPHLGTLLSGLTIILLLLIPLRLPVWVGTVASVIRRILWAKHVVQFLNIVLKTGLGFENPIPLKVSTNLGTNEALNLNSSFKISNFEKVRHDLIHVVLIEMSACFVAYVIVSANLKTHNVGTGEIPFEIYDVINNHILQDKTILMYHN